MEIGTGLAAASSKPVTLRGRLNSADHPFSMFHATVRGRAS